LLPEPSAFVAPQPEPISPVIQQLSTTPVRFAGKRFSLPYMPICLEGILSLALNPNNSLPPLRVDQAKVASADIIRCGYYGDALGSELESRTYAERKRTLLNAMSAPSEAHFVNHVPDPVMRDQYLIAQLQKKNLNSRELAHRATDDTQQGVLSAIAKTDWILNGGEDLDALAGQIAYAFHDPKFPVPAGAGHGRFDIRGGANTLYMCKFAKKPRENWKDVAIEDVKLVKNSSGQVLGIQKLGVRAGGAGNGGMMRLGYDLLPLLSSNATTQALIEQVLISNQVTHPSSFSAVASVGQVIMMARCINLRLDALSRQDHIPVIPPNFFLDTYHEVARALEHPDQKFGFLKGFAEVPERIKHRCSADEWQAPRLPSEFLRASPHSSEAIRLGSVEQALIESEGLDNTSASVDSVLKRWSSNSYLGATFPSVVFLLERFGRANPAHAVNMAALVTKDSDTCATIVAQVMGALYGSVWVDDEFERCIDSSGNPTFDINLGAGFSIDHLIAHMNNFYDRSAAHRPQG
ncbi:MAG TPA: ADP-ribosylglycohydrolase family protein, partial [Limnobacter sp.]|nr:ADP-ribosylglycohydrolase family protein [Limnobacter sp.]